MARVPLGIGAYDRSYGNTPPVRLINRFFEKDPTNLVNEVSLFSRPGATYLAPSGQNPFVRGNFTLEGAFAGALFTVSGTGLQRMERTLVRQAITGVVLGDGIVSMAATATTLWVADGSSLQFYQASGSRATGTLTATCNPSNTQTVTINGVVYTFNTVLGGAYSVLIGATASESLLNLSYAINATAAFGGINYGTATVVNAFVYADTPASTDLIVRAKVGGVAGNAYTTTETSGNLSWGAATLTGGAANALSGVQTPDDVGIVSVCVLGGYTFCLASADELIYWINPGEVTIDPINRIAAEATPDQGISLITVGDVFYCFGAGSTQVFYLTGGEDVVAPIRGRAFATGILAGTETLTPTGDPVVVGSDGVVYLVAGSSTRISNNGIEQIIRQAREIERAAP